MPYPSIHLMRQTLGAGLVFGVLGLSFAAGAQTLESPRPTPRPEPVTAETRPQDAARLFAMPGIALATRVAVSGILAGDLNAAAAILDGWVSRFPDHGGLRTSRAALAMLEGDPENALAQLRQAVERGGLDIRTVADDPLLSPLANDPVFGGGFAALAAMPPPVPSPAPVPTAVLAGQAPVTVANTGWNPLTERLEPRFSFPPEPFGPVLPKQPKTAAHELLREHVNRNRAAGNHGDLYDNRDRGHSALKMSAHPQLAHVLYGDAARKAGVDYGLAGPFLFDRPTLGNSSTAFTNGALWRSQPRHALTSPDGTGPMRLWQTASANHLYMYPAHKDFTAENGDVFPANTPYLLISRGSSGSDKPFLEAVAMILAAFRPDTKERLVAENMIVPTVQMVFRRSLQNVMSRESYFGGDAHPVVFDGWQINLARMVSLANAIRPEDIPAEVRIRVEQENPGVEGIDFFGRGLSEKLFDTPGAIARVWRSKTGRRTMILDVGESRDINGNPLTFYWRLLQGDPEKVNVESLDGGKRARITLDWHDPFEISGDNPVTTARVDIGVFAHNGTHDSAPAILSWYFPPHQKRIYELGPDGAPQIVSIDHASPDRAKTYTDPQLFPRPAWRDRFFHDADGTLTGWTRYRANRQDDFTSAGDRILGRDADGTPIWTEPVIHVLQETPDGTRTVQELSGVRPAPHQAR